LAQADAWIWFSSTSIRFTMAECVSASEWVCAFLDEKGSLPTKVEQLHHFIRNRGGEVSYREVRTAFQQCVQGQSHRMPGPGTHCTQVVSGGDGSAESGGSTTCNNPPLPQSSKPPAAVAGTGPSADDKKTWIVQLNKALLSDTELVFRNLPEKARADRDVVMAAVRRDPLTLRFAADALRDDLEFMTTLVKTNATHLQYASDKVRADYGVVLAAVQKHGTCLQYASDILKSDKKLVLTALQSYQGDYEGSPLRFASYEVMTDREVVLKAMEKDVCILRSSWFPDELKADRAIMLYAIGLSGSCLQFASSDLKDDPEVVGRAIRKDPFFLRFAGEAAKDDFNVVLAAMHNNRDALRYASASLRAKKQELEDALEAKVVLMIQISAPDGPESPLTVLAISMGGNELASCRLSPMQCIADLRDVLAKELGTPAFKLQFVATAGQLLDESRNAQPLSEVFSETLRMREEAHWN